MPAMHTTLLEVCGRTAVIYTFLFGGLRLLGKRELSQFSPFDLILLLTLANGVQNAMVGDNTSLPAGLAAAGTLMLVNYGFALLVVRAPVVRRWLQGTPTVLARDGKILWRYMAKERLDHETLMEAVRQHGFANLREVKLAVLELDGSISVVGGREPGQDGEPRQNRKTSSKRRANPRLKR